MDRTEIENYKASLCDIKDNTKTVINYLTMIAEDNVKYSSDISKAIEEHIRKASMDRKLYVLYLVDSILKNVKNSDYPQHFSKTLIPHFRELFIKSEDKIRISLWKLRETWCNYFSNTFLYNLDLSINSYDRAWPVRKPIEKNNIHVNPHFKGINRGGNQPNQNKNVIRDIHRIDNRANSIQPIVIPDEDEDDDKQVVLNAKVIRESSEIASLGYSSDSDQSVQLEDESEAIRIRLLQKQKELLQIKKLQAEVEMEQVKLQVAKQERDDKKKKSKKIKKSSNATVNKSKPLSPSSQSKSSSSKSSSSKSSSSKTSSSKSGSSSKSSSSKTTSNTESKSPQSPASNKVSISSKKSSNSSKSKSPSSSSKNESSAKSSSKSPKSSSSSKDSGRSSSKSSTSGRSSSHKRKASPIDDNMTNNDSSPLSSATKKSHLESTSSKKPKPASSLVDSIILSESKPIKLQVVRATAETSQVPLKSPVHTNKSPSTTPTCADTKHSEPTAKQMEVEKPTPPTVTTPNSKANSKPNKPKQRATQNYRVRCNSDGEDECIEVKPVKRASTSELSSNAVKVSRTESPISKCSKPLLKTPTTPPLPLRLNVSAAPPARSNNWIQPSPKAQQWSKFKEQRPTDFPVFSQPRPFKDQDIDHRRKERHDSNQSFNGESDDCVSGIPRLTRTPKRRESGEAGEMIETLQNRLANPNTLESDKPFIASQVRTLINKCKTKIGKMEHFPLRNSNFTIPRKSKSGNIPGKFKNGISMTDHAGNPWYDIMKHYVIEHDTRWYARLHEKTLVGPLFGEVVVDGYPIEMYEDIKPRSVNLSRLEHVDIDQDIPEEVAQRFSVNLTSRSLVIANTRYRYNFGDPPLFVILNDNRRHNVFFRGVLYRVWIQGIEFEIYADAPIVEFSFRGILIRLSISSPHDSTPLILRINDEYIRVDRINNNPHDITINNSIYEVYFRQPVKSLNLQGRMMSIDFSGLIPITTSDENKVAYGIRFDGEGNRDIVIDDKHYIIPVRQPIEIELKGVKYRVCLGGPGYEVIFGSQYYTCPFDQPPITVRIGKQTFRIQLRGDTPSVVVLGRICTIDEIYTIYGSPPASIKPIHPPPMPPKISGPMFNSSNQPVVRQFNSDPRRREVAGYKATVDHQNPAHHQRPLPYDPDSRDYAPMASRHHLDNNRPPNNLTPQLPPPQQHHQPQQHPPLQPPSSSSTPLQPPSNSSHQHLASGNTRNNYSNNRPSDHNIPVRSTAAHPAGVYQSLSSTSVHSATTNVSAVDSKSVVQPRVDASGQLTGSSDSAAAEPVVVDDDLDVDDLMSRLITAGLLALPASMSKAKTEDADTTAASQPEQVKEKQEIPNLSDFNMDNLKICYDSVIDLLYTGVQCKMCGIRYRDTESILYKDHLDWHFRQNKLEKEQKSMSFRKWYYSEEDWLKYEEISDLEEQKHSVFFESLAREELTIEETKRQLALQHILATPSLVLYPQAHPTDTEECLMCHEPFEQFWNEEEEQWHLKDAVRDDDLTYHPICYDSSQVKTNPEETVSKDEQAENDDVGDVKQASMDTSTIKTEPNVEANAYIVKLEPPGVKIEPKELKIEPEVEVKSEPPEVVAMPSMANNIKHGDIDPVVDPIGFVANLVSSTRKTEALTTAITVPIPTVTATTVTTNPATPIPITLTPTIPTAPTTTPATAISEIGREIKLEPVDNTFDSPLAIATTCSPAINHPTSPPTTTTTTTTVPPHVASEPLPPTTTTAQHPLSSSALLATSQLAPPPATTVSPPSSPSAPPVELERSAPPCPTNSSVDLRSNNTQDGCGDGANEMPTSRPFTKDTRRLTSPSPSPMVVDRAPVTTPPPAEEDEEEEEEEEADDSEYGSDYTSFEGSGEGTPTMDEARDASKQADNVLPLVSSKLLQHTQQHQE